jgi:hypothetical protein
MTDEHETRTERDEHGARMRQAPLQRWLVLTEHGVELQPTGNRGLAWQFATAVRPFRRRTTVVSETRYQRVRA